MHPDGADEDGADEEQLLHLRGAADQDRSRQTDQAEPGRCRPGGLPAGVLPAGEELAEQRGRRREGQELTHQGKMARQKVADAEQDHDDQGRQCPAEIVRGNRSVPARRDSRRFRVFISPQPALDRLRDRTDGQDRGKRVGFESRAPVAAAQGPRDNAVGPLTDSCKRLASPPEAPTVAPVPPPCVPDALGTLALTPHQRDRHLRDRPGSEIEYDEQAMQVLVVLEDGAKLVATTQHRRVAHRPRPGPRHLNVANAGRGCDDDSRSGDLGPPAQVHVLAEELDVRIESSERPEQVGAYQDAAARYGEHLAAFVVLSLVELAALHPLDGDTEAVDADADLEQVVRGVPLDELRSHDARVGAVGLPDQATNRVGSRSHIVVADQQMRGALDRHERLVRGRRETLALALAQYEGAREHRRDSCRQLLVARGVHHEHVEVRVVLSTKRLQAFLEPQTRVTSDHHGDDRRGLLLRHRGHATADAHAGAGRPAPDYACCS